MQNANFDLRIKLENMLNSDDKEVMPLLIDIFTNLNYRKVHFWHNGEIQDKKINKFLEKWSDVLSEKNIILNITEKTPEDFFCWFDIIDENSNEKYRNKHRFKCIIKDNQAELINAIFSYYNTVTFISNRNNRKYRYIKEES